MKRIIPVLILVLQVLCASALPVSAQVGPYTYAVDDGTADNAIGLGVGGNLWWANGFTAQAGAETINTVQIAFHGGYVTAGMPFKVMIYEDPDDDGNPGTGPIALLAEADATVVDASGGTFQDISIGPATVAGKFFVAALINHTWGQYPAALDQTTSAGVSWLAGSTSTAIDPSSPFTPAPEFGPFRIDDIGLPGNFLLRAVGGAVVTPAATTQAATAVGTASATLNGQVNANGASTTVTFEYGPTAAYGSTVTAAQSPVTGSSNTAVSADISGLASGATYHFRVVAQNAGGTTYGGDLTFTTNVIPVTTAITRPATDIDFTSATLNGLVNAIGHDTIVTFEYGPDTSYGNTVTAAQSPVTGYVSTLVSAKITGLVNGATCHFRVAAENSSGITYGDDRTFTAGSATTARIYSSHIDVTGGWQTEIGLVNTSIDRTITGMQTDFNSAGGNVGTGFFTLSPNGRIELGITNESVSHASIDFVADPGTFTGYTKFYRQGICRAAIPTVSTVNTGDIYIPHIASDNQWWTGISLTNTEPEAKEVTIVFNDGQSVVRTIAANGHTAFTIAELFGGQPQPGIKSGVITSAAGIIGLELFGSADGSLLEGLPLTDNAFSTLYYPHVACDAEWWTGIVAYNPWDEDCDITITAYDENGILLLVSGDRIPAGENYVRTVTETGLPDAAAWFKIEGTLPLAGFELFGTHDNTRLAAYAGLDGTGADKGVFAKIEKNGWTGLGLVNTEEEEAFVTLVAYDDTGNWIAIKRFNIGGHARILGLAESIFLQDISQAAYIGYSSNKNIVGFQLNGTSDGAMLDGLPALTGNN